MNFRELNLDRDIIEGLDAMRFEEATPIQEQAIPIILDNEDLIACAQTGTGKTAAYLLPVLHKIVTENEQPHVNTIIIAPTRELAKQIDQQVEGFAYFVPVSSYAIYGGGDGVSFMKEKRALTKGADIIISTPGKLISHLNLGYVKLRSLKHLILDEADKMLDMGFFDDILRIITHMPDDRQTILFSATMPDKMRQLAKKIMKEPKQINIALSKPAEGIDQRAYSTYNDQKVPLIKHIYANMEVTSSIIFSSTKSNVKVLAKELARQKYNVGEIHSDLDQNEREEVLRKFKNKRLKILVATDIVSRGIDVESIDLIINYDVPQDAEDYIHRVGRTARAESTGTAITFINPKDQRRFKSIEDLIERVLDKTPLPEHIGEGPKYNPGKGGGGYRGGGNRKGGGGNRNRKGGGYKGGGNRSNKGGGNRNNKGGGGYRGNNSNRKRD